MRVVISAVWSRVSGANRASSASRWVSSRDRHSLIVLVGSSSVRYAPTSSTGRSRIRRASSATISRLSWSAHCRSSKDSIVGAMRDSQIRSTTPRTRSRRERGSSPSAAWSTSRRSLPSWASGSILCMVRARSRTTAPGTVMSCGARSPLAISAPRLRAFRATESRKRLLPMPASPARRMNCPRPSTASASRRSARSSRSSRPTSRGQRSGVTRLIRAVYAPASIRHRSFDRRARLRRRRVHEVGVRTDDFVRIHDKAFATVQLGRRRIDRVVEFVVGRRDLARC